MREKRAKRTDEEKLSECAKNRQRTRNKRAQETDWNLQNKRIRNAHSMKQKRNMQTAVEKTVIKAKQRKRMSVFRELQNKVLTFRELCLNGPNHVCASCKRLMYAHMVTKIADKIYQNANKDLFHKCLQTQPHPDSPVVVCKTCKGYLQRNKMPTQCQAKNLLLDSIPEELK